MRRGVREKYHATNPMRRGVREDCINPNFRKPNPMRRGVRQNCMIKGNPNPQGKIRDLTKRSDNNQPDYNI